VGFVYLDLVLYGGFYAWALNLRHSFLCRPPAEGRFSFVLLFTASRESGVMDTKFCFGFGRSACIASK
jgi:hypothetical protein